MKHKDIVFTLNMKDTTSGVTWNVVCDYSSDCRPESPLVTFYDASYQGQYDNDGLGQMVSCYYAYTLVDFKDGYGLDLYGGIPEWSVDAKFICILVAMLKQIV